MKTAAPSGTSGLLKYILQIDRPSALQQQQSVQEAWISPITSLHYHFQIPKSGPTTISTSIPSSTECSSKLPSWPSGSPLWQPLLSFQVHKPSQSSCDRHRLTDSPDSTHDVAASPKARREVPDGDLYEYKKDKREEPDGDLYEYKKAKREDPDGDLYEYKRTSKIDKRDDLDGDLYNH